MDKIENIVEHELRADRRWKRASIAVVVAAIVVSAPAVVYTVHMSGQSTEVEVDVEPIVIANDMCADITEAGAAAIGTFTEFLDEMNNNNAVLASIAQRAATRGLVNSSDTEKLREGNDRLETLNADLRLMLAQFEREAARCYAAG